jgi:hypothetical protein
MMKISVILSPRLDDSLAASDMPETDVVADRNSTLGGAGRRKYEQRCRLMTIHVGEVALNQ